MSAAALAFAVVGTLSAPGAADAVRLATLYVFPERLALQVDPGDVKVRAGERLRIVATLSGPASVVPVLRIGDGNEAAMEAAPDGFAFEFEHVDEDFTYAVAAAGTASREYTVTVVRPPRVERIDLRYQYPPAFRMAPREEEDGGDIYGPAGTRVQVTVHVDKPVTQAALNITGGAPIALESVPSPVEGPTGNMLQGVLVIGDDGSYRVALADSDGLSNPGDTEYFIRTLQDRPPDVRIVRPASDRQVTRVEEVAIEARADDDFGIAALDLVFTIGSGPEKAVPFEREGEPTAVSGRRTIYLEDLPVKPGDFVAYYARARDVSRGKRSTEARSDIFFLEVTPFEEEFVASQSQGSGSGGDSGALEDLIQEQKDIVTATWNLDRRSREAGGRSDDDIRAVEKAQRELRTRAMTTLGQMRRAADLRRRNTIGGRGAATAAGPDLMIEAITRAVEAMERARQQLERLKTAEALPQEMNALNELLRAQAEVRRREVQQQANGQGGRGANRQQQDMSSLFDRELARQQQTNYETPGRAETRDDGPKEDDALEKIQDLARRQDALNKSQQELARNREQGNAEELKRQLERLTREQSELRREAEELARQLQQEQQGNQSNQGRQGQQGQQQSGQGQQGQQTGQGRGQGRGQQAGQGGQGDRQQASRDLQQISDDMQGAASELRRDNPGEASARGSRAAERLRDLEQRMRSAQPDDRRRALGEMQLESRQLADAQRRLGSESSGGQTGGTQIGGRQIGGRQIGGRQGDAADRARRQAAEQERLADRTERLEQAVRRLAGASQAGDARERNALNEAVREIEQQRPSQQMRNAARAGQPPPAGRGAAGGQASSEQIARALERIGDRLGAAGGQSADSERLTEELSRIRQLREELAQLDRQLAGMREQLEGRPSPGAQAAPSNVEGRGGTGRGRGEAPGPGAQSGGVQNGNPQEPWENARELVAEMQRENRLESLAREADGFNPGRSAPGTEGWKQDFAKWDELKVQMAAALERAERTAADTLREQQANDRLNAGASQAVPEGYRRLVEKYYRALAK
jgi:hypothetical protein